MIKIIADSGCDFTKEMLDFGVVRVPLTLQLGDKTFEDSRELDIDLYLKELVNYPSGRKTAAPSPEKYYNACEDCDAAFIVTLSRKLSGSYQSAVTGVNMYIEDKGEKPVYVIDSKTASAGETAIVHKLMELINEGKTFDEIKAEIDSFIEKRETYFIFECFDTIVDTGRMNKQVAKLASMLNIMPVCYGDNGVMAIAAKARGRKRAYSTLIKLIKDTGLNTSECSLYITNVAYEEEARALADELVKELNFKSSTVISPTGLVCTYGDYHGLIIAV